MKIKFEVLSSILMFLGGIYMNKDYLRQMFSNHVFSIFPALSDTFSPEQITTVIGISLFLIGFILSIKPERVKNLSKKRNNNFKPKKSFKGVKN